MHAINDIVQKQLLKNLDKFDICEEIDTDLTDKNIILIDELVSSGKTMEEAYKYLKVEKRVNKIYPTCVSLSKWKYKGSIKIDNVLNELVIIWPWGYDN